MNDATRAEARAYLRWLLEPVAEYEAAHDRRTPGEQAAHTASEIFEAYNAFKNGSPFNKRVDELADVGLASLYFAAKGMVGYTLGDGEPDVELLMRAMEAKRKTLEERMR